jgi:hypothetical protein
VADWVRLSEDDWERPLGDDWELPLEGDWERGFRDLALVACFLDCLDEGSAIALSDPEQSP